MSEGAGQGHQETGGGGQGHFLLLHLEDKGLGHVPFLQGEFFSLMLLILK